MQGRKDIDDGHRIVSGKGEDFLPTYSDGPSHTSSYDPETSLSEEDCLRLEKAQQEEVEALANLYKRKALEKFLCESQERTEKINRLRKETRGYTQSKYKMSTCVCHSV